HTYSIYTPSLHDALPISKILPQKPRQIEFTELAPPQLQAVQILILRENALFLQANTDFVQQRVPLPIGHKTHGQRRKYRIYVPVSPPAPLLPQRFCDFLE